MKLDLSKLTIRQIEERLLGSGRAVSPQLIQRLQEDPRTGLRKMAERLKRQRERRQRERARLRQLLRYQKKLWESGIRRVAGVDEAGLGPLAGPIIAAAVVFAPGVSIPNVDDSKKLNPPLRTQLAKLIHARAEGIGIGRVNVVEMDDLNVYQAGLLAMRRAVKKLPQLPQYILTDDRTIPGSSIPQDRFPQGDRTHFSIAAASIIAKTHRDSIMLDWDHLYPQYGFAHHKGYPTAEHKAAIRKHGLSEVHRLSLVAVRELAGQCSPLFHELQRRLQGLESVGELKELQSRINARDLSLPPGERRRLTFLLLRRSKQLLQKSSSGDS